MRFVPSFRSHCRVFADNLVLFFASESQVSADFVSPTLWSKCSIDGISHGYFYSRAQKQRRTAIRCCYVKLELAVYSLKKNVCRYVDYSLRISQLVLKC